MNRVQAAQSVVRCENHLERVRNTPGATQEQFQNWGVAVQEAYRRLHSIIFDELHPSAGHTPEERHQEKERLLKTARVTE